MSKIDIKKLEAGKRYRMIIEAETNIGDIINLPSIEFTVPEAAPLAKSNKLSIQRVPFTSGGVTKSRLFLTIPENIMSNLVWKDDVRDVVHIVYRSGADSDSLPSTAKYLLDDSTVDFAIPNINFTYTKTGTASSGATSITLNNTTSLAVGMPISGTGIADNTTITAISSPSITISKATTSALSSTSLTFYTTRWASGHPNSFKYDVPNDALFYSFQFIIARYTSSTTGGTWTQSNKYWLHPGTNIKGIISQPAVWSK